jgi:hypothetical protein
MSLNRSESLSLLRAVKVCRRDVRPLVLAVDELYLYFCFLTPRSLRNEPMMTALETAVAARISPEANTLRYCWLPRWLMTDLTLYAVIPTRMADMLNRRIKEILRLSLKADDLRTMGMGKMISRTSVMMSAVPIVSSCA